MNVLWISNIPFPEASELMGINKLPTGGWMVGAANALKSKKEINLSVAFPSKNGNNRVVKLEGEKITYYSFPQMKYLISIISKGSAYKKYLDEIVDKTNPDLVVIWGTEYAYSLVATKICKDRNIPCAISIQGLLSIYAIHFMANVPISTMLSISLREILPPWNLMIRRFMFLLSGKNEKQAIRNVKYILGRTDWDRACAFHINPQAMYFHNNEILRPSFYKSRGWDIDLCEKYSIFITQGGYPIKGLHFMLEAMSLILKHYPQAKLYVSGGDLCKIKRLKRTTYQKYLRKLIKNYNLEKNIEFLGSLSEKQICNRFLNTHVYVSSSSIENESNSLSEAKILGVPCVASYVGGVTNRIDHGVDGFTYQHDAPYMLAYFIMKIFESSELALLFSKNAKENANVTNNIENNVDEIIKTYTNIVSK